MGDAQSAQRDAQKDAEPGEDVQTEQSTEDKPLENKEPIPELNGKADGTLAGFNGHSVDAAEGIPSPDKDVSNVEIDAKKLSDEEEEEEVPVKTIEMEAKQNEINESFKRFFNNIGLKLTVKKGSAEKGEIQVPEEEPNKQEDIKDTAKESENAEQNKELNAAQEAYDNDSTTGPTMTDGTSEDLLDTETKMEAESNKADAATSSHGDEGGNQEAAPEDVVVSPFKRFSLQFKTGFFSGLRKKKKEPAGKELVDMGKKEEATEQTVQDQQQDKVEDEDATVWKELQEIKPKDVSAASAQTTDEAKSPSTDPSAIIVTESEILSSQEKVQASPMRRLLSGSSLKKRSKKQRGRKLSDGRLSDSGEHTSDHLMSSTESADNPREDSSPQSSAEATGEEEGPWASFKKLMTPKKRVKGSSSGHEEAQVPASGHEAKPSQGEQTSDHSSEEGRKRKDSSVSWEAVLCGSGRRRSRKTSDSEEESPQNDNADDKQDTGAKQGTETQLESSNDVHETLASSTRQAGSLPEGDGGSTWQSFKKLVTPKRKAKNEDEGKDNIHSDSEITQDDSSFSIKKLLPGRKKRKSGERQDQVSSDEAEKEVASGDEDSETPAVVPLSEFDTAETGIQIQTQADIESDTPKELEDKLKQDDMAEPVLPCDDQQIEATTVQEKEEAVKNEASTAPVTNEEPDEELISKHQQLSDITEEGAITDTMATPASTNEEAVRDDTIAEDLIEITSEAITAPEPADVTLADETEMISAVSQLSESSKTSGNTTPVPAELDVKDTELLLQNVVENIQMSQDTVLVCSEDPGSEKGHPDVEATDAPHDLAAAAQPESMSDTNEAMSTDIISEVPTEEFDTAEITADDAYKEDVSQLQDTISELEVSEESRHKVECVSEVNEAVSVETLPEGEEVVPDSVVEADEAEISKMDSQDAEPAAVVAEGPKDGAVEQEIQILVEKEDQILENVPEQAPFEDQPAIVADKKEEVETVETSEFASEKSNAQSLEKNFPFSEDILTAEKVTDELKQTAEHLTGVTDEPENKEPQSDEPIIDQHEVTEVVQEAIVDSEDGSVQSLEKEVTSEDVPSEETLPFPKVGVMRMEASKTERIQEQEVVQAVVLDQEVSSPESLAKEVISEDVPPEETVTDKPKEETVPLIEDNVAPVDIPKIEHIQKTEASQAVQAATLDSEGCSPQVHEKEVISEDVTPEEKSRDETKEEPVPLAEGNAESVDASKAEHIQEEETLQTTTLDSEPGSPELPQKDVISEDVPPENTVQDEPKEEPVLLAEGNVEQVDAPKMEHIQEPETLQATTVDSEASSPQLPQKEIISEEVPSEETVREEPKEDTVLLAGVNAESVDASKMEHIQEPEVLQAGDSSNESKVLQATQAATLDSEASGSQLIEKKVKSEDVPPEETVGEPKEDTVPLAEGNIEPVDAPKTEHIQEPETLQATTIDSEEGSPELPQKEVISEDIPSEETIRHEPKQETVPLAEVNVEPMDAPNPEHIQELETLQTATLDSEAGSSQLLEKEVISEDVPPEDTVSEEVESKPVPIAEVDVEPMDAPKKEHIQDPETLQAATLDSEAGNPEALEKKVISEDVPPEETVKDESKEEAVPLAEASDEPVDDSKTEQELEGLQAPTLDLEAVSSQLLEKEVISEDVPPEETVDEEVEGKPVPIAEVNVEPVDAPKTEHIPEPETLQATTLDSEAGSSEALEKKAISEDVPPEETVKDESKEEAVPLAEDNDEPVDDSKIEQEPEVLQAATLESGAGSSQLSEKEVILEDAPPEETVTNEPKQETVRLAEVNVEPMDAPKTEHIQELETLQATTLESEAGNSQLLEKEVISEDIPPQEAVSEEVEGKPVPIAEGNVEPVDAPKTEHIQDPEPLEAATLDSEAGSSESLEKKAISEDVPPQEMVKDESKEEAVPLAESNDEPVDDSKTEQVPEVLQAATLESEVGSSQLLEKEVISMDAPPEEKVSEEGKDKPVPIAEVNVESADAPKTKHIQEPETLQATTTDSEVGSPELSQKRVISEVVPPQETVKDKPKEEAVPVAEGNDEPVNDCKIEQDPKVLQAATLDSEAGSSQLLEKQVISEDVPPEETVGEEVKDKTVSVAEVNVEPADASKTKHIQEPEVLQAATLGSEASSPKSLEKVVTSEDIPPAETVQDEPKKETAPPAEVNVESMDTSKEPETLQTVQETTSNSEAGGPQLLEKKEISEDVQVETATDEPKEAPEVSTELEKSPMEPEASAPVTKTETGAAASSVEECHAQEKQILLDDAIKPAGEDVIASVPEDTEIKVVDQALERNNDRKTEHLAQGVEIEDRTTEAVEELETTAAVNVPSVMEEASCVQILEETVLSKETPEPCVDSAEASDEPTREVQVNGIGDKINGLPCAEMKTAEVQHVVVMQVTTCNLKDEMPSVLVEKTSETHAPLIDRMAGEAELKDGVESAAPLVEDSVEVEDNQRIQVQVVDVDTKSLIEVVVTENKNVTDVCHETIEKVEVLSATSGIEDEVFNKKAKAAVQEDIPHVKENLPRTIPESLVVSLEQEILKEALTEVVENVSNQMKNQEEIKDDTEKFTGGQNEGSAVTSDGSAIPTEHHDSHMQTSDIPEDLDVSLPDQKEDLEKTKANEIHPSEELAVKKVIEKTTEAQQTTQIITTSNTGLVTQQNTGTISSVCNVESPTSFSFEVKFNIQFEKTKVPDSPTSPTETLKPVKQTDVSEVGIQVVETVASINATERDEEQITEPAVNLDSNKMAKITSEATQLDVGIRAVETITPVEEITSTETVTPNIQAAETIQQEMQTESTEVFLSQPVLNEAKAKEPTVEENEVWQDAEEEISTQQQTETVKEPREQDEKAEHGQEAQQETHKTKGTHEIEGEGEHFVAALEYPETVTAGDMTVDLN